MYLFFVHPLVLQRTQESCTASVAHAKENNNCWGLCSYSWLFWL